MYTFGLFTNAFNILPYAYFILAPFAGGRNPIGGNRTVPFHSNYYRKYWYKLLFGKHLYVTAPFFVIFKLSYYIQIQRGNEILRQDIYAVVDDLGVEYNEEESKYTKKSLEKFRLNKLQQDSVNKYLVLRAEMNYKMKSEVFDDYISRQEN
jgi:hypothetical protein